MNLSVHEQERLLVSVAGMVARDRQARGLELNHPEAVAVLTCVVLGRHDEPTGSLHHRLRVDRCGAPLVRTGFAAGPRWPGSMGPAGTAGARAVGALLLVGAHDVVDVGDEVRLAVQSLADDVTLVTAVAGRPGALTAAFDALVSR